MDSLTEKILYALADASGIVLEIGKHGEIFGSHVRQLAFADITVEFNSRVVSSRFLPNGDAVMLVRVKGNLTALFAASPATVTCCLLNLSQVGKPDGWLEEAKFSKIEECITLLGKAVVKTFEKDGQKWKLA